MRHSTASLVVAFATTMAVQSAPLSPLPPASPAVISPRAFPESEAHDIEERDTATNQKRNIGGFSYHKSASEMERREENNQYEKRDPVDTEIQASDSEDSVNSASDSELDLGAESDSDSEVIRPRDVNQGTKNSNPLTTAATESGDNNKVTAEAKDGIEAKDDNSASALSDSDDNLSIASDESFSADSDVDDNFSVASADSDDNASIASSEFDDDASIASAESNDDASIASADFDDDASIASADVDDSASIASADIDDNASIASAESGFSGASKSSDAEGREDITKGSTEKASAEDVKDINKAVGEDLSPAKDDNNIAINSASQQSEASTEKNDTMKDSEADAVDIKEAKDKGPEKRSVNNSDLSDRHTARSYVDTNKWTA